MPYDYTKPKIASSKPTGWRCTHQRICIADIGWNMSAFRQMTTSLPAVSCVFPF